MNEEYLKSLLIAIVQTLVLLLEKGLFSEEQKRDRDQIIQNLKNILIHVRES